jgi:hypothetical protein
MADTRYSHPGGETCYNCNRRYQIIYLVPDEIWRKVWKEAAGEGPDAGHLCPLCFDRLAWTQGISLFWRAEIDTSPIRTESAPDPPEPLPVPRVWTAIVESEWSKGSYSVAVGKGDSAVLVGEGSILAGPKEWAEKMSEKIKSIIDLTGDHPTGTEGEE